jgi:hypothetical protein
MPDMLDWLRYRFHLFRLHREKRRIQAHLPKSDRSSRLSDPTNQFFLAMIASLLAWVIPATWWLETLILNIVVIIFGNICLRTSTLLKQQHFIIRGSVWIVCAVGVTAFGYPSVIDRYTEAHPKKQVAAVPDFLPTPLSLKDLFETDFSPGTGIGMGLYSEPIFGRPSGENIPVKMRIVTDFDAHSKFLAFYLAPNAHNYDLAIALAIQYKELMDHMENVVTPTLRHAGDSAEGVGKNLPFVGQIYLYTEADMTLQEKAALERFYNGRGLSVQFRGSDYQITHSNQHRPRPAMMQLPSILFHQPK